MVLIREFRIVMPMTLEEYEMAIMYTIVKMEQEDAASREAVEVLQNVPYEDEVLGKGQYTSKVYHLQSKIPAWMKTFAPANAFTLQEESWSAFPKSKTEIKCPHFDQRILSIETVNKADNGCSENVHGLSDKQLALRKVEVIDIASAAKDYWSKMVGASKVDFSTFKSNRTGRGPLFKGWKDTCHPVMTSYKLVITDAPFWAFGNRLEEAILAGQRALFLECHRRCFAWIDEWFGMTLEQVCELERLKFEKTVQKSPLVTNHGACKKEARRETRSLTM
ncbi:phosphatidylinositol transfer protein 2-like [Iris pallida]|uniref:Phosphatidylinositol transfer protein 2-like n=1 Tax=Iris pallida TaxID=29817 RepID=A0AAX6I8Q9_IRIPA|nr:phosphatidylinositol transfer protein 2-like [Iris pallida]